MKILYGTEVTFLRLKYNNAGGENHRFFYSTEETEFLLYKDLNYFELLQLFFL